MRFNDLPVELLEMILDHLPLTQRIRCRLVDKKWRFIVDNLNPKSLVFSTSKLSDIPKQPFTNKPVKLDNLLIQENFSHCFKMLFNMIMFKRLEKLYFAKHVTMTSSEVEKCLNYLLRLRELTVGIVNPEPSLCKLSLPSLEVLKTYVDCLCKLVLDTPNLSRIHLSCSTKLTELTFLCPERIHYLRTYGSPKEDFGQFINLQFLSLIKLPSIETSSLLSLTNLKEINFLSLQELDNREFISKNSLLDFAERVKKKSKSKNLKINYGGFFLNARLSDCQYSRRSYRYVCERKMRAFLENLDNLSDTLPAKGVFFDNGSFSSLINRLPKRFFRRFVNLKT